MAKRVRASEGLTEERRQRLVWRGILTVSFAGLMFGGLFLAGAYGNFRRGLEPIVWLSEGLTGLSVLGASTYGLWWSSRRLQGDTHGHDH
ncbi:MAG TPA: hypothetical protein VNZ52_16375 [Candidatus Thermoplasmatota archaeon]|nr:hypothetical protein [Candidatus Thermoplasmatota archaeon]